MSWNGLVLADSAGCVCLALPRWADCAFHTQHNGQWLHHSVEQFGLHPKLGFSDRIYRASLFLTADAFLRSPDRSAPSTTVRFPLRTKERNKESGAVCFFLGKGDIISAGSSFDNAPRSAPKPAMSSH